ncbi:MAG: linear amide C-N hydrolase [Bacteroidales bacterium]|nr:linear amide C-N hydrolase [Candidatus Liminaster caballi]
MKKILIIIALILIALASVVCLIFGDQYKAATSVHLVTDGMYEYTFEGDYGLDDLMAEGGAASPDDLVRFVTKFLTHGLVNPESLKGTERDFGCSSICTPCTDGTFGVGRNFDWPGTNGDMVIIHSHPKTGYSSISSFYIPFLGFGDDWKPAGMQDKFMLLASLFGSLDGMNEKGLYVADLVAGDKEETHQDTGKPNVTTTLAIRLLLNKAASVEEALQLLNSYDQHSDAGFAHHLAISDADGRSVVVEWVDNKMLVIESALCTNHYLALSRKQGSSLYYDDSQRRLDLLQSWHDSLPSMTMEQVTQSISSVASQEFTRWTVVFDRQTMSATYYQNADFSHPYVANINK